MSHCGGKSDIRLQNFDDGPVAVVTANPQTGGKISDGVTMDTQDECRELDQGDLSPWTIYCDRCVTVHFNPQRFQTAA